MVTTKYSLFETSDPLGECVCVYLYTHKSSTDVFIYFWGGAFEVYWRVLEDRHTTLGLSNRWGVVVGGLCGCATTLMSTTLLEILPVLYTYTQMEVQCSKPKACSSVCKCLSERSLLSNHKHCTEAL